MKPSSFVATTWLKRICFLTAAGFFILGFLGKIDLSHPFLYYLWNGRSYSTNLTVDQEQILLLISFIVAGILFWSLWDKRH